MHDSDVHRKKIAIQCFTSAYPLLFKHWFVKTIKSRCYPLMCSAQLRCYFFEYVGEGQRCKKHRSQLMDNLYHRCACGGHQIGSAHHSDTNKRQRRSEGRYLSDLSLILLLRFAQMQSKAEPNLSMCSSRHPFLNAQTLEDEAKKLLEECIKLLYISTCDTITLG